MEKYFKHINYTTEDIAAGKYEAWDVVDGKMPCAIAVLTKE